MYYFSAPIFNWIKMKKFKLFFLIFIVINILTLTQDRLLAATQITLNFSESSEAFKNPMKGWSIYSKLLHKK